MDKVLFIIFLLLVFLLIGSSGYLITDMVTAETVQEEVVVLEKVYKPSSTSTGVATGINPTNGQMTTGVVTTSESESYTLIVEGFNGEVFSTSVKPRQYAQAKEGQNMTIGISYGGLSGARY